MRVGKHNKVHRTAGEWKQVGGRSFPDEQELVFAQAVLNGGVDMDTDSADIEPNMLTDAKNFRCRRNSGSVRNWATMESFAFWTNGRRTAVPQMFTVNKDIEREQQAAAVKAKEMLQRAVFTNHGYLKSKGFPLLKGLVLDEELLIPMRDYKSYKDVLSVQRIKEDGTKRFLYQGRSKGAVFILNQEHQHKEVWLVEGYATGLSVQAALKSLYRDAAVVVCFSASNMVYVGQRLHTKCYAVADNDTSGTLS